MAEIKEDPHKVGLTIGLWLMLLPYGCLCPAGIGWHLFRLGGFRFDVSADADLFRTSQA